MPESIRVHQALFGYREGHNLLGASVSLAPTVRHFLATITDASGSENARGFEGSYTCLPVPQTDFYAVFCTWSAPEMPRPGCVWSHVLLIELADLARIRDLGCLRNFIKRPEVSKAINRYEQPITISTQYFAPRIAVTAGIEAVLGALYGQPNKGIVVLVDNPEPWKEICFSLWSQQWPRLRRNFAFSTGSLGDRRLADIDFDLQVAPESTARLWRRSSIPTEIVEVNAYSKQNVSCSWLGIALRDLNDQRPIDWVHEVDANNQEIISASFREFIHKYGSDIEKPRSAFARLGESYRILSEVQKQPLSERLTAIGRIFPNRTDAVRLKEHLMAIPRCNSSKDQLERVWETASFLLGDSEAQAYAQVSFNHCEWVAKLWQYKRQDVLSLFSQLVRHPEKPSALEFARSIASVLEAEELPLIACENPELIPAVVNHKPVLAQSPKAWELNWHTQWQVYETLENQALDQETWSKIEAAMCIAATSTAVFEVVKKAGMYAIDGAFLWLESDVAKTLLPAQNWKEALAPSAADLLKTGKQLSPEKLTLCCWLAPADEVRRFVTGSREDVKELARSFHEKVPPPLLEHAAFVLVATGLREPSRAGAEPLIRGFFDTHESLRRNRFSLESWQILSRELPKLEKWRDWDQCEKLRRAVRDWAMRYGVQDSFLNAAVTDEQRDLIAGLLKSS